MVNGAPEEPGVYALWERGELLYVGSAPPGAATIRSRLMQHFSGEIPCGCSPTDYCWRLTLQPQVLEKEWLGLHKLQSPTPPRCNVILG